ncbi:MAG: folate-binding protein YgfZ [Caulobacterales bacterium]|nr:folate-binding protein YgfZ [Caulobacterales bacterium]
MPVAHLDSRALISVSGPDCRPFLHSLLTQDVSTLSDGEVRYGALLGPQGRLLFDLFLFGREDAVLLDCAVTRRDDLMRRLGLYRLRADVRIEADPRPVFVAWNDAIPDWPSDPRLPNLGRRSVGSSEAGASLAAWRSHCLVHGVPDSEDFALDSDYPIDANLDLLNGIDFKKGCFIGQEVTSRMKRRGKIKSRLVPIRFEGGLPPRGTEILNGDLRAGEIRSGQDGRAMAMLRLDRIDGRLMAGDQPIEAERHEWLLSSS